MKNINISRQLILALLGSVVTVGTFASPDPQAEPTSDAAPKLPIDATITFFYYDDLDTAARFYRDTLGLEMTTDMGWVWIFRVTETSSVGLVDSERGYHAVSDDKPTMLSFVTDDVDAWYRRLVDAGVPILKPLPPADSQPDADLAPIRAFIAADPGGYTIEFFAWR